MPIAREVERRRAGKEKTRDRKEMRIPINVTGIPPEKRIRRAIKERIKQQIPQTGLSFLTGAASSGTEITDKATDEPQLVQNRASGRSGVPHLVQYMTFLLWR